MDKNKLANQYCNDNKNYHDSDGVDVHEVFLAGFDAAISELSKGGELKIDSEFFIKVVENWRSFWMNQKANTGCQKDHENYFSRAFGIDANMKYHLASKMHDAVLPVLAALQSDNARIKELEKQITTLEAKLQEAETKAKALDQIEKMLRQSQVIPTAEYKLLRVIDEARQYLKSRGE